MSGATSPVPRSVRLALWLAVEGRSAPGASRGGSAAPAAGAARALHAAADGDDPHTLRDDLGRAPRGAEFWEPSPAALVDVVARWLGPGCRAAALLPSDDDNAALPVLAPRHALRAGECLLVTTDGAHVLAVPHVERYGSAWESGHAVAWSLHEVGPWERRVEDALGSLEDARAALRHALIAAAPTLPTLADDASGPAGPLPEIDEEALVALAEAARARTLVAALPSTPGVAGVDRAARRLLSAVTWHVTAAQEPPQRPSSTAR